MGKRTHANGAIYPIPLSNIEVSRENVRHEHVGEDLGDLAASIKKHGLLQPVVLRGEYEGERPEKPYQLIVGQRRLAAHEQLGEKKILARFAGEIDDTEAKIRSLVENMVRVELTYADAAGAVTDLYERYGRNDRKVAEETGMSLRRVRQYLSIEERASEGTKRKLAAGKVRPVEVQRALDAAGGDTAKADELLRYVEKHKLTPLQQRRMRDYGSAKPDAPVKEVVQAALKPSVERAYLVNLPEQVRNALAAATEKLNVGAEELIIRAVMEWLSEKGFIRA
jgi:ParB family chromosome partitioning protein